MWQAQGRAAHGADPDRPRGEQGDTGDVTKKTSRTVRDLPHNLDRKLTEWVLVKLGENVCNLFPFCWLSYCHNSMTFNLGTAD